ncbi:ParB/RepB/Spo0J family partition protein [Streptomyces sp. NBC_01766]|uniref:ParB/RepB/Spo0J family partition protein n=1 Tax=Streptomyces sp. NBC_01766 TaxID=2975936 RepID=UPI002DD7D4D0|nr:ParB/RepB/Spo0J family partition protein [Streptomyces sp. NBC_01766]WSC22019.1 ParB/RepB/Spo0J family partition protein [Streptomyces sp. NBC_01766]
MRPHGFWSSRNVDGLYIRRSQDKEAQMWRINGAAEALRAAGHEVTIEVKEEVRRSFAEAEADRADRAEGRVERFSDRAGRAVASADARRATADQISQRFEFGQPILVGHHSEGRARRDAARIDTNMRKSFEERDRASHWADRTRASENYEAYRNNPQRTLRRLERLRADLRQQERHHTEAVEKGYSSVDRHARLILDLTEEIAHWEQIVEKAKAEGMKIWGPADFAPGDFVLYSGSWYQVARVNPKTLSIAWNLRLAPKAVMTLVDADFNGRTSTHSADYTQARARCPEDAMDAFLADGKVPGIKSARVASEAAPADVIREAQAKAKMAKAKKATRRSDPKIPKRIRLTCEKGATDATLTWLDGRGRPHKDHPAVTVPGPVDPTCIVPEWSGTLQSQVAELLAERGLTSCGDWVGRDGGIVRAIAPVAKTEPEAPAGDEDQAPVDEPGEDPKVVEKTPSDLRFLSSNPVPQGSSEVGHSVHPLNPTPHSERPGTMTDIAATATVEVAKVTETAPAKKSTRKATARKAPAVKKVVEPTKASKRREVVAEKATATAEKAATQKTIPIDRIDRDPNQPRELFDQAKLEELAGSMRKLGQLQPISVRYDVGTRRYTIIMGERRWRAAKMADLTEMTALVLHGAVSGSPELLAKQVAENVGRADMTPMEEAKSFKDLEKAGYTIDDIGEMCGKAPAYVGWRIDLLKLCDSAQDALAKGLLGVNLAWYAAQLSAQNQMRFLSRYTQGGFANDRDAEAFVKACRAEEERRESQGSFFVLSDEATGKKGDVQESILGEHDVPEEERERIISERSKLTKKIERLSAAGEILAELATADPEELALLLAGAAGGVEVHSKRMEHLRKLTGKVIGNLTKAQAIASVRAGGIEINPDAVGPEAAEDTTETEAAA